ncbi:MAG: GyrI-like domain-containing protein [Candidatus Ratteibacteria bacterium]|nr:GyrI-like domain-containing protein [Candidatus Ratteibacteria bacterium]
MKKALIIIVGVILVIAAMGVFFIEKMMLVDTSKYEYLKEPRITEMPNQKMIEIALTGNPNETAGKAMGELFTVFFTLKGHGPTSAPRARWIGDFTSPETMVGKYAMPVSDNVTQLPDIKDSQVKLTTWQYGTVVEILHMGPYDQEWETVKKLMNYAQKNGYQIFGEQEEEYLKGPDLLHLVKPKDYYTIIRYRVIKR